MEDIDTLEDIDTKNRTGKQGRGSAENALGYWTVHGSRESGTGV